MRQEPTELTISCARNPRLSSPPRGRVGKEPGQWPVRQRQLLPAQESSKSLVRMSAPLAEMPAGMMDSSTY